MDKKRCPWAESPLDYHEYHDKEWGVPIFDDARIFEFLLLESAQAGLSWITILRKRSGYRECFAGFDPLKIAAFTPQDVERLMQDARIVRNRKKIEGTIKNANAFLELQAKHGTFSKYIWGFVDGKVKHGNWKNSAEIPALTPVSEAIAKDMKKHGFTFLGPTVVYAHMQASGMVNDHLRSCFRYKEIKEICKQHNV